MATSYGFEGYEGANRLPIFIFIIFEEFTDFFAFLPDHFVITKADLVAALVEEGHQLGIMKAKESRCNFK